MNSIPEILVSMVSMARNGLQLAKKKKKHHMSRSEIVSTFVFIQNAIRSNRMRLNVIRTVRYKNRHTRHNACDKCGAHHVNCLS